MQAPPPSQVGGTPLAVLGEALELVLARGASDLSLSPRRITDERRPLYHTEGLFKELPSALQESAFIDRLHGLLEGWFMPRITKNTPSRHLGLKGDFFGEVLHELRPRLEFADYVTHSLRLPSCEDMRDNKAIARIAEGYLKLLFPDLNVTEEQFSDPPPGPWRSNVPLHHLATDLHALAQDYPLKQTLQGLESHSQAAPGERIAASL